MYKQPINIDAIGFADIHCHMLAGVDDGAQTIEEMTQMARLAKGEGIDVICFTPHSGVFGNDIDPQAVKKTFADALVSLKKLFPDMNFYLGNELYYGFEIPDKLKSGVYLPINGSRYVLVEFSPGLDAFNIESGIKFLTMAGYTPIIAHVERYKSIFTKKDAIKSLRELGALIQVNSRSIMRRNIFGAGKCSQLLREGLVDLVATDCHDTKDRPPEMRACYEYISGNFGKKYADKLMKINPRLVLANKDIMRKSLS